MSINSIINTAYTGLSASQAAIRTISNNVANVNTPGYARQTVDLEGLVAGGGGFGVRVSNVQRVADSFLSAAAYSATSDFGRFETLNQFQDRLQGLIGSPDSKTGLAARADSIFSSIADLTADPADGVRRQAVISEISRFLDDIASLGSSVQALRVDASSQIGETVTVINQTLQRTQQLNSQIVRARASSQESAGLEEQRAQALNQLAELVDIRVQEQPDGSVQISTARGQTLLDHAARRLDYNGSASASAETTFPAIKVSRIDPVSGIAVDTGLTLDADLTSGRLSGLIDLRDEELPAIADGLGELARGFRDSVNAIHNANTSVPPPPSLIGRNTGLTLTDPNGFSGTSTFAVVDTAGTVVAKTTVDFGSLPANTPISSVIAQINAGLGGAATVSLTNGKLSFSAAAAGNGVVIADDPTAPSQRAGQGFSQYFGLNDLIVGDQPSSYNTGFKGSDAHLFAAGGQTDFEVRDSSNRVVARYTLTTGGVTYNDLLTTLNGAGALGSYVQFGLDSQGALSVTSAPNVGPYSIRIARDTSDRGGTGVSLSSQFGLGVGVQANGARGLSIRKDIQVNPFRLGLAKFDPAAAVGSLALGVGDQRGAVALRGLQDQAIAFRAAGPVTAANATLSQYLGSFLGETAIAAQTAEAGRNDAEALRNDVIKRRDDFSGVNLDEELANLVVFQNSYSAAARVLTAARDIYDTLLNVI